MRSLTVSRRRLPPATTLVLALLLAWTCVPATLAFAGPDTPAAHNGPTRHGDDAEHHPGLGERLPLWSALPFAGILLSIALFPLLAPHFWHHHYPKVSLAWALILAVPFLLAYRGEALQSIIHIAVIDYIPFIILLWALFTIAGGIFVGGALQGTPGQNTLLLLVGTLLASWIGTTGSSIVLIRPVLRANAWRRNKAHVVVFFIFLVSNIGGSLTPLGDPPLFLGFLHGVPFFWVTTAILRETAVCVFLLLLAFYLVDRRLAARESGRPAPVAPGERGFRVLGLHNLLLLLGVMGGVLFSGSVKMGAIHVFGHVQVEVQNLVRDGFLLLMGWLSLRTTARVVRERNEFGWGPIREVAILFAAIFVTIIPALAILQAGERGAMAGFIASVREPIHFFWATGGLSSFLDNAPTYLTFFNTALGSLGVPESQVPALLGYVSGVAPHHGFVMDLTAVSAGAVFMGANTYIGNAPNFMVKSIAEEAGVPMPSFFGYMLRWSIPFLIPTFVIVTLLFFR